MAIICEPYKKYRGFWDQREPPTTFSSYSCFKFNNILVVRTQHLLEIPNETVTDRLSNQKKRTRHCASSFSILLFTEKSFSGIIFTGSNCNVSLLVNSSALSPEPISAHLSRVNWPNRSIPYHFTSSKLYSTQLGSGCGDSLRFDAIFICMSILCYV